jgi:hypothetical protein
MSPCEHFDDLNRYMDGELAPEQAAAMEQHLRACTDCRQTLSRLQTLGSGIRDLPTPRVDGRILDEVFLQAHRIEKPHRHLVLRRHPWLMAAAAMLIVALGVASVGVMARWTPEVKPAADVPSIVRFVASPRFKQLTEKERAPYIDVLRQQPNKISEFERQGQITAAERDRALQVLMEDQVVRAVEGYYALQPGLERQQYLDRLLADQEKRAKHLSMPSGSSANELMEAVPAHERTRVGQFLEELRRRQEGRGGLKAPATLP